MFKKMLKSISNISHIFFYNALTSRQRSFFKKILTEKQKKYVKNLLKGGKKQKQLRAVEDLKYQMQNLGFVEQANKDLQKLLQISKDKFIIKLVTWELALWHANQNTIDDAKKCLEYLKYLEEQDYESLKKVAILKAECHVLLGQIEEAKIILNKAIKVLKNDADVLLAFANLETCESKRIDWVNKAMESYGIHTLLLNRDKGLSAYDRICIDQIPARNTAEFDPKVTVIMPVYNAEDVIRTSITSILKQTWTNLELLVVDDCSNDNTVQIVNEFALKDKRIKLIGTKENGGAYVARNIALTVATGVFITINDADDWSHPVKIESQVLHLLKNKDVIGNTSEQVRMTNQLKAYRRGKPGLYIFSNMSSFMFRKEIVMDKLGYWDSVRFGADSELIKRIKKVFGEKAIVELETGPLSFQRQTNESLTGNSAFGFPGYFMGARKEYLEAQNYFHSKSKNLKYFFPQTQRPFHVPEPMLPNREFKNGGRRHFDIIIVSDFRLDGGSTMSNIEEIRSQMKMGLRTGLVQLNRYDYSPKKKINPLVRDLLNGDTVQMIVFGEKVSCDLLILRYPPILQVKQKFIPDIKARNVCVVVNQTPMSHYGEGSEIRYNISTCEKRLVEYFGESAIWFPIGPKVRHALHQHHLDDLNNINLSSKDWVNIINTQEWKRCSDHFINTKKIRIGRHSRGQAVKWPSDPREILEIYPNDEGFEIKILGGAETPKKILGEIPNNWYVYKFGEIDPKDFLSNLDVFVYYTHPDWVESFGRVIIEAMAVGVPVIIPPSYQELFEDAAIYAHPSEVKDTIINLINDQELYNNQVKKAQNFVEQRFGYMQHGSRLEEFLIGR